jgi:predicted permease
MSLILTSALRSVARRPLLAGGIIATLALAFAATLLVLGLLNSYLLRPLPYAHASRLVAINEYPLSSGPGVAWRMTFGNAADIHDQVRSFRRTAIVRNEAATIRTPSGTEVAFIQKVTPEFFPMLGLRPAAGEVITAANAELGGQRALLLSHDFWLRRFGGNRDAIGQTVQLDQLSYRIVGVLPAGTELPLVGDGQQAWVAMLPADFQRDDRSIRRHFMFGELDPNHTLADAQGELAALAATLRRDFPQTNADRGLTAIGLREALLGNFRQQLFILQAVVGLVLVVACVNAGCLLLAQAIRRRREFAVRLALGAATRSLFLQFFFESLWLALAGAGLGLLLATWLAPLSSRLVPEGSPLHLLPSPAVTATVTGAALVLAVIIAAVFSLVPLLQARRLNLEATLRDGSRQAGSVAGGAATRLLVSLQVAVALALLIIAGQLVRSFQAVQRVDRGLPAEQLYTFRLGTRGAGYEDPAARVRFYEGVVERLQQLPHVAAGGITDFAFAAAPGSYSGFRQEGDGLTLAETPKRATRRLVSVGLLDTLQLKLLAGRWLTADDRADTARVAVISQSLAEKYWPGQNPIGRRVELEADPGGWRVVVGVVSDLLSHGPQPAVIDSFFVPHTQLAPFDTGVFIRTRGDRPLLREEVNAAVAAINPETTAYAFQSAADFYARSAWQTRFGLVLVGAFAGLAVTLCLTGVYAVLAFAVAGRTSEFGVRLALGASRGAMAALVLRDAVRMTVPGLAGGLVLAWLATRLVSNLLFQVSAVDPWFYGGSLLALAAACLVACLLPARRAMQVDPLVALRTE